MLGLGEVFIHVCVFVCVFSVEVSCVAAVVLSMQLLR